MLLQTRSLVDRNGDSAFSYVRVFKILEVALDLVRSRKQATQRDLYYRLLSPPIFESPRRASLASEWSLRRLSATSVDGRTPQWLAPWQRRGSCEGRDAERRISSRQ